MEFHQGPPDAKAEFVCQREEVLKVSQRPSEALRPVVCLDEGTKQLVKPVTPPIAATESPVEIIDCESERNGTGNVLMLAEPLAGRRQTLVTAPRTAQDDAEALRHLVDELHPNAEKMVLVPDHLDTHKPAALDHAFPPEAARRLIDKLEIHDTPKQGSWLNMAEIELGSRGKPCLDQRLPNLETRTTEVAAGNARRNEQQVRFNWQFTTADARIKLKRLDPVREPLTPKLVDHWATARNGSGKQRDST